MMLTLPEISELIKQIFTKILADLEINHLKFGYQNIGYFVISDMLLLLIKQEPLGIERWLSTF